MDFKQKYLKYKKKYIDLRNQNGGAYRIFEYLRNLGALEYFGYSRDTYLEEKKLENLDFYFSVYVFSKNPLDESIKNKMVNLLQSLYGGEITIVVDKEKSLYGEYIWDEAVRYIDDKSNNIPYYKTLKNVTSFVINNIPSNFTNGMDDEKLTIEEHRIKNCLNLFELNTLSVPDINGGKLDPDFSRGWGFQSSNLAVITLVIR